MQVASKHRPLLGKALDVYGWRAVGAIPHFYVVIDCGTENNQEERTLLSYQHVEGIVLLSETSPVLSRQQQGSDPRNWQEAAEKMDKKTSTVIRSKHNIWALVIGINAYRSFPLRGAVPDALSFRDYLMQHLRVPLEQICVLLDENASRHAILEILYQFRDNCSIQSGDSIIVYFAGHGSSYDLQECFSSRSGTIGFVDAICPVDRGYNWESGTLVPDISLRELNLIFAEINDPKSSKIALILDCSHNTSAFSANWDPPSYEVATTRTCEPLYESLQRMLHAADSDERRLSARKALAEDWWPDNSSYVIFAACQDYESTREEYNCEKGTYHGQFTKTLLDVLRLPGSRNMRFTEIAKRVAARMQTQTPFVSGLEKNSIIWFPKALETATAGGSGEPNLRMESCCEGKSYEYEMAAFPLFIGEDMWKVPLQFTEPELIRITPHCRDTALYPINADGIFQQLHGSSSAVDNLSSFATSDDFATQSTRDNEETCHIRTHPSVACRKKTAILNAYTYQHSTDPTMPPLKYSHKDLQNLKNWIFEHGYNEENITILVDVGDNKATTRVNIINHTKERANSAKAGDSFIIHVSGHGGQCAADVDKLEVDGTDELIYQCDYHELRQEGKEEYRILDNLLRELLADPLPKSCRLLGVVDCCSSGTVLDLPIHEDSEGDKTAVDSATEAEETLIEKSLTCKTRMSRGHPLQVDEPSGLIVGSTLTEEPAEACPAANRQIDKPMRPNFLKLRGVARQERKSRPLLPDPPSSAQALEGVRLADNQLSIAKPFSAVEKVQARQAENQRSQTLPIYLYARHLQNRGSVHLLPLMNPRGTEGVSEEAIKDEKVPVDTRVINADVLCIASCRDNGRTNETFHSGVVIQVLYTIVTRNLAMENMTYSLCHYPENIHISATENFKTGKLDCGRKYRAFVPQIYSRICVQEAH